jgi:hypothetical protein
VLYTIYELLYKFTRKYIIQKVMSRNDGQMFFQRVGGRCEPIENNPFLTCELPSEPQGKAGASERR